MKQVCRLIPRLGDVRAPTGDDGNCAEESLPMSPGFQRRASVQRPRTRWDEFGGKSAAVLALPSPFRCCQFEGSTAFETRDTMPHTTIQRPTGSSRTCCSKA